MGFGKLLVQAVEDADPHVRTFARVVLERPPVPQALATPENTKPYEIDSAYREQAQLLAKSQVPLDPSQKLRRMESVAGDLLMGPGDDPTLPPEFDFRLVARVVAAGDPLAAAAAVLTKASATNDPSTRRNALETLSELGTYAGSNREGLYGLCSDFVTSALSSPDPDLRHSALKATMQLAPPDVRYESLLRLARDPDPDVSYSAALQGLDLLRTLESAGQPELANQLLDQLSRMPVSKEQSADYAQMIARSRSNLANTRDVLLNGKMTAEGGKQVLTRFLSVHGNLVDVSQEEYDDAISRVGKPYVSEEQFNLIRHREHERVRARNLEPLPGQTDPVESSGSKSQPRSGGRPQG